MYAGVGAVPPVLHAVRKMLSTKDWANIAAYARAVQKQGRGAQRQAAHGFGAFMMPALDWKQIAVGTAVGVGLGYVFFAKK